MDSCDKRAFLQRYKDEAARDNYIKLCGIDVVEMTETGAVAELSMDSKVMNINGDVHGGALFSLADVAANWAAYVWGKRNLGEHFSCTTVSSSFNYLRAVNCGEKVIGRSTLRKTGKSFSVVDVSLQDENGTEVCCGSFTIYYLDLDRYQKNNK